MFDLKGKVVVIIGGVSGMGCVIVELFIKVGVYVICFDILDDK